MSIDCEAALKEMGFSETLIRILNHAYEGIIITLKDSTIIFVNNAYSRLLGISREKLLGRKLSEIESNSIVVKVLKSGVESIHASEYIRSLNERVFGSVLLFPSPKSYKGSISIFIKSNNKIIEQEDNALSKYIEIYMDEKISLKNSLPSPFLNIVGQDRKFKQVLFKAYKASLADFPVLVIGESGTGKELLVRAIHENSSRRNYSFVPLNCAAITTTLVESELFGYEGGSFTGASKDGKKGMFDLAHRGTLFFDEVGDFELSTQAKILRVLEEKVFKRVGGSKDIQIDTRIISATNKDLEYMVLNGRFREDLFYRINTMSLQIPPLRERGKDLELLANYFLVEFCSKYQKKAKLSDDVLEIFYNYNWHGNVRELRNVLDYAINMTESSIIGPKELPSYLVLSKAKISLSRKLALLSEERRSGKIKEHSVFKKLMHSFEREIIKSSLEKSKNRNEAMKLLGLSRRAFYLKMNKHGLM